MTDPVLDPHEDEGLPQGPMWLIVLHLVWVAVSAPFRWLAERTKP